MSSILSQGEIDALLEATPHSGRGRRADAPAGPAVRYNFRRPDRISNDQLRALQFLHERCARDLSTSLSAYLRTTVSLSVASVDQLSYSDLLRSFPDPTAFYAIAISHFEQLGALELNPSVAFAMLDRMLGGSGQAASLNRPLTDIEQNVADAIVNLLLDGLAEAWKPVSQLTFTTRARETRPQMLQVAAPNEIVVAVVFDVRVGDATGHIHLCIPIAVVETTATYVARGLQRRPRELSAAEREWLEVNLARVPVPLVPLIRTRLKAGAVVALQPGEVVSLPLAADQPLDVCAGGVRKFTGRLAADQGRLMLILDQRAEAVASPVVRGVA